MNKFLAAFITLLLCVTAALSTEKSPAQIKVEAATTYSANGIGAITGPNIRNTVNDIADSFYAKTEGVPSDGIPDFIQTDLLPIVTENVIPLLTKTPNGRLILLVVNGQVLTTKGAAPAYSQTGTTLTWSAANAGYSIKPTDVILAIYTHN